MHVLDSTKYKQDNTKNPPLYSLEDLYSFLFSHTHTLICSQLLSNSKHSNQFLKNIQFQFNSIQFGRFQMETPTLFSFLPTSFTLPLFFTMFLIIYLTAQFIVFRHWSPNLRPEASSCLISLAHGTPAVFLASHALLSDPNRSFASVNTNFQNTVLDYSIAYFLMDLCHYLIFYPNDILFIAHHLATLFVFVTCRYLVSHGAYAILVLLVLAEVTSFCQNTWTLASARKADSAIAAKVYDFLSLPFYALYSLVRGLVGPLFVIQMGLFYSSGAMDDVIPRWVWISWIVVIVMAISVSILWISNLWVELYRNRTGKLEKKIR